MNTNNTYAPPFTISSEAINLISKISAQVERFVIRLEQEDGLKLRKINRIKTIHSSLAIEGNTLTEDNVRDIINGKTIIAPIKEIQEVKNAIETYEQYSSFNPFNEKDLLRAHGIMMQALDDNAGRYRNGNVGVFGEKGLIHLAPPANRVSFLMKDLFQWLKNSNDNLLIQSCVFHYEFEFIHPFNDGNGRIGRLWQSLILGKFNPVFEHLPIENIVYANQQEYYEAIAQSTKQSDSAPFIDFMLNKIHQTLSKNQDKAIIETVDINVGTNVGINVGINEKKIISLIKQDNKTTAKQIAEHLSITLRQAERLLANLKKQNIIRRIGSNKGGFWEVITTTNE